MRSEYKYRGAGPLRDLAGRKNRMLFPSSCAGETGIYTDARVQRLRQIQQPQANNPFVNKYSKDQCGKMRHNSFGAREKAKWKRLIEAVTNHRTNMTSSKEQMKKFSPIVH